jgi:GTP pyrophosphokinase
VTKRKGGIDQGIRVHGVSNVMIKFARCCNPVYGDKIIGYITRGSGVSVHKVDCTNIDFISQEKDRLVKVEWIKNKDIFYPVKIKIAAQDRGNLISDIMQIFTNFKISVSALNAATTKDNTANIDINFSINSLEQLKEISNKLMKIKSILSIKRAKTF